MQPWKTLSRKTVFAAEPYLSVDVETVELPDGQQIEDYYRVHMRDFALVVPVMEDGRILMLRQYKHGPRRVSITFPAGYVEAGEAPDLAIKRELMEETGCEATGWTHLGSFTDQGNQGVTRGHYYLATGCRQVAQADAGDLEEMQEEFWSAAALDKAVRTGDFAITHQVTGWLLARMAME